MASNRKQELADLTMLERLMRAFLRRHSRPRSRHEPIQRAHEHILQEQALLKAALSGDEAANRARSIRDATSDTVGK